MAWGVAAWRARRFLRDKSRAKLAVVLGTADAFARCMNWETLEGKWHQVQGSLRAKWGKLTDDDVNLIGGKRDTLIGRLEERYGIARDKAERQVDEWIEQV